MVSLQMPSSSWVGGELAAGGSPIEIGVVGGLGSVLGRFEEVFEEFKKPEWKGRSYRELKETLEILVMVGFFED